MSVLKYLGFPTSEEIRASQALEASARQSEAIGTITRVDELVATAVAVEAQVPALAEPVPIPDATVTPEAELPDALRSQYVALAAELGVNQPGLVKDAACAYFRDRGMRLYDRAKVKAYLDGQYGTETSRLDHAFQPPRARGLPTWCWRPLRARDVMRFGAEQQPLGWPTPERNDSIWPYSAAYKKPVPLPVLLMAKDIAAQFPSAGMYVSDEVFSYEHRNSVLDPFLLVVIENEWFIVERWDEPAYRE